MLLILPENETFTNDVLFVIFVVVVPAVYVMSVVLVLRVPISGIYLNWAFVAVTVVPPAKTKPPSKRILDVHINNADIVF